MSLKIEGKVTLNEVGVEGAVVRLYNNTEEEYLGFETTDSEGDYEFTLADYPLNTTDKFLLIVEYEDNGTFYNSVTYNNVIIQEEE